MKHTILTVIFWAFAIMNVYGWLKSLTSRTKVKPFVDARATPQQQAMVMGCMPVMLILLLAIFSGPLAYLQWFGLASMGLSGWWAIVTLVVIVVNVTAALMKNESTNGGTQLLNIFGLLIAYQGLQVLA